MAETILYRRTNAAQGYDSFEKAFKGSDEELQALIDWLSTLKKAE